MTLNCVSPGPTDTELLAAVDPTGRLQQALARAIPMGRVGRPDDIPGAVAFLWPGITAIDQKNIKIVRSVEDSLGGPMTDSEDMGWFGGA